MLFKFYYYGHELVFNVPKRLISGISFKDVCLSLFSLLDKRIFDLGLIKDSDRYSYLESCLFRFCSINLATVRTDFVEF